MTDYDKSAPSLSKGEEKLPPHVTPGEAIAAAASGKSKSALYSSIESRWQGFKDEHGYISDIENLVDGNGDIVVGQTNATFVRFIQYVDSLPKMSYHIMAKALSFCQNKLDNAMIVHGKRACPGYVRGIPMVKVINDKWKKERKAPITVSSTGEVSYTDLHARIDDRLTQKQMIHCCNLLLSNDDGYMSTKITPLSRLGLLVDLRGTHTMMGRSEDGRSEIIVFIFF